jgi:hypothetical protein
LWNRAVVEVHRFTNAFGERIGLVLKIMTGPFADIEPIESARWVIYI